MLRNPDLTALSSPSNPDYSYTALINSINMKYSTFDGENKKESSEKTADREKVGCYSLRSCLHRVFVHRPTAADQDKGFSWLVLFWATMGGSLTTGLFYGSYGPLNIILQKKFDITVNESSFICSINSFLWLFTTPLTSVLTKKLSCRKVQMMGGFMIVTGLGGCAFTDVVWPIYPLYGVLAGFGASCCYVSVPGVLVHHFRELKFVAFAVAMFGNRTGGSIWASLSQLLFSSIGFSYTMGVLGLVEILSIVAGLFMTEQECLGREDEEEALLTASKSSSDSGIDTIEKQSYTSFEQSETSSNSGKDDKGNPDEKPLNCTGEDFQVVREMRLLLSDWTVWCLIMNFGFWSINSHGFYFFINDYVVKYSAISETDAALGVSIMGAGSIAGCVLNIAISKRDFDRMILYTPLSTIYGVATILMIFTDGKLMLYTLTLFFGVSYGLSTGNLYAVCFSFHGAKLMNIIFGLGMCAQGFTGLLTGPICSYLQTNVHHMAGIGFAGATGIAASLSLVPVIIKRYCYPDNI